VLGFGYVQGEAAFEQAQLFEALGLFEFAGGECGETLEREAAVGVEAEVLPVVSLAVAVAIKGNGGTGEVEGAAIGGGDDFDGVGVRDVFGRAADLEGSDIDAGDGERLEERRDVFGEEERLVALDVDVDIELGPGLDLGDGEEAVGAAGEVGGGEEAGPTVVFAELLDLGGVGGDDDVVEFRTGHGGSVDPDEEGLAGDGPEDFAGKPGGGKPGRNDADDPWGMVAHEPVLSLFFEAR